MKLENKIIVVTGAASGLGKQTAEFLQQRGAIAIGFDLQQNSSLKDSFLGDVTHEKSIQDMITAVIKKHGAVHALVNCAGIAPASRIVGKEGPHSLELFSKTINVNLIGTFNMMRLVAAQMLQQDACSDDNERGVIINTASIAAFEGQLGQAAYSASKGGVLAMTLPAARELSRFGIRVMTIAPGIMQTPMMAAMAEKVQTSLAEQVTFPKRLGHAQEYASLVVEIINNTYLNASVIRLDGGIRLQ